MNKAEILIIDDEPQIRKLLEITLESNGYKTLLAETGKEGVIQAANHPPELILLDIGLPDKSGHEILKELRQWYNKAIIILSVQNDETDIVVALDNGATEFNLISLFALNEGRVLTHQFILKEIWGVPYQTETQYLRVFVASLRKKIEENTNQPMHIITESGVGYRFQ